jgi:hypothetical protein
MVIGDDKAIAELYHFNLLVDFSDQHADDFRKASMRFNHVALFQLFYSLNAGSSCCTTVSMNASTVPVVVSSHVVDLAGMSLGVKLCNRWSWRWELDENGIDFAFIFSEELPSVSLKPWVLEVRAHLNDMSDSQGRQVMFAPFTPPLLFFQCLSDLAFAISVRFHVSDQRIKVFAF